MEAYRNNLLPNSINKEKTPIIEIPKEIDDELLKTLGEPYSIKKLNGKKLTMT